MSTNTPEAQELLRLYKCVIDTGADVLVPFAEDKLLKTYSGNFERFLDDKKHDLFHLWHSKKLLCCACLPAGCTLKRTGHMDNWIFEKLYDDVGIEHTGHIIRNSGKVVQMCLHKYVKRNIGIHELDTVALSFLLQNFATLLPNEDTALVTIKRNRNKICHAHSANCYDMTFLNTAWTELEKSLVDLTSPSYKGVMKKQIKYLRKVDLEKEEIMELLSNVEKVLQEVKSSSNNNVANINGMETRLRKELTNKTDAINQHTTEETSHYAAQAQQAISEKIQNTEEHLHKEMKEVRKSQENSYQKIGSELHETRIEVKENQEKTQGTLVEISRTIKNLEMFVRYERPNVLVPEGACSDAMESPVLWQISTPEDCDLEAVVATLRRLSQKDELFKIKFVRKGSLIMLTTIAASVLRDANVFEAAVMSFLTKMIEDCDINTEIRSRVDVKIHILNANEVSISCELPHVDLRQPNSGDKKHLLHTEKFDVAFLNGDDEKEIEWVQSMSTKLKTKYDIQCSILAKDYLNGFPLQRRLGLYLSKFQAVIVTLTKENYKQYEFYITDDMPVIAVELDYLNEIGSSLRKHPFINCTTCEHLWFPRLIDILKNKLPDYSGKALEKEKDEIIKDCEKCKNLGFMR
ncbi:uncharacterized protein [Mytilus edulis]|uniref:uncharacterized protein n=1 Tax=Mytilus edulis TaxID=6550 RepID=UPI0039EFA785